MADQLEDLVSRVSVRGCVGAGGGGVLVVFVPTVTRQAGSTPSLPPCCCCCCCFAHIIHAFPQLHATCLCLQTYQSFTPRLQAAAAEGEASTAAEVRRQASAMLTLLYNQ